MNSYISLPKTDFYILFINFEIRYMKTTLITILLLSLSLYSNAQRVKNKEFFFLIDITDKELFQDIKTDIQTNFAHFAVNVGFGEIKPLNKITFKISPINDLGVLSITTSSIGIKSTDMSGVEIKKNTNPKIITNHLNSKLTEYETLVSKNAMSQSSIMDVTLKALIESDLNADENMLVIFSDMIENSNIWNMYKQNVPKQTSLSSIISRLDQVVYGKLKQKLKSGFSPCVVIVLKQKNKQSINNKSLKLFWNQFFTSIGIKKVQFIDDLSNTIEL